MEASMDDQGQVVGSKLHNTMQRIDPSFNFKSQGYRTFRQFLSSCKEVTFTQPEDASDVVVQLAYARERGYNFPAPTADGHTNNSEESSQPEDKGRRPSRRRSPRGPRSQQGRGGEHSAIQPQVEPQTSDPQPVESAVLPETVAEVEPAVSTNGHVPAIARSAEWDIEVDRLWSERNRDSVFGPVAAGDAAKALGVSKLSASEYPSLDALLEASPLLRSKWRRERNRIQKI
jgi:hypothetical protein